MGMTLPRRPEPDAPRDSVAHRVGHAGGMRAGPLGRSPSCDLLAAAWQRTTVDWYWWETQRSRFDLYTSDVALEEAHRGDPEAARNVLKHLRCPCTGDYPSGRGASKALLEGRALLAKEQDDALHLAVSAVPGIDYLLTWEFSAP